MAQAFKFVCTDVRDKLAIIETHRRRDGDAGASLLSLLDLEVAGNLTHSPRNSVPNASRTLLRLTRAMGAHARRYISLCYAMLCTLVLC